MQLLRTLLFVPGCRPTMIEKARGLELDAIVFDLEDSVPPNEKARARELVRAAIPSYERPRRQVWVRLNSSYTNLTRDDVLSVVTPGLDGVLLPKADSAAIVRYVEGLLRDQEERAGIEAGKTKLIAAVESAAALLRAAETVMASSRLAALAFGAEDYTADLGVERTDGGEELQHARYMIALVARAAGLPAIDTAYPRLHDSEGLMREARLARRAGFSGKLLIHPEQIGPVAGVFTPSEAEATRARRIVDAYREASERGLGAVQVDGAMVDAPVAKRAERLLELVAPDVETTAPAAMLQEGQQGSGSTPRPA